MAVVPTVTANCEQQGVFDLAVLLDSSGSVGNVNFQRQTSFIADLVSQFDVGPTKVQVAVASFDSKVNSQFSLGEYKDTPSVVDAIRQISYSGGSTATDEALRFAREVMFDQTNGHRDGTLKVVLLATDGSSNNQTKTEEEAFKLKQEGARIYPVAVGPGAFLDELQAVATNSFVFQIDSFDKLQDFLPSLQNSLCLETMSRTVRNEDNPWYRTPWVLAMLVLASVLVITTAVTYVLVSGRLRSCSRRNRVDPQGKAPQDHTMAV